MEERDFGGAFQFRRNSNLVISVVEVEAEVGGNRRLRWSVVPAGQLSEAREMYTMELEPISTTEMRVTYSYDGQLCEGRFILGPNVLLLTHIEPSDAGSSAVVSLTYRIVDSDTMALVVAECDTVGPSRLLTGSMQRVDLTRYAP